MDTTAATPKLTRDPRRWAASTTREDLIAAAFGLWLMGALYTDGWAHLNVPGMETFFTPWHAVLYSGFAALALCTARLGWKQWRARPHESASHSWPLRARMAFPPGYGLSAIGVGVFLLGGVGDMLWHTLLGIETGIDALVSPTHLLLLVGAGLLVSGPVRADRLTRRSGSLVSWPAVISYAVVAGIAGFFLSYTSVFVTPLARIPMTTIPEGAPGHEAGEMPTSLGLASYLLTTALLTVPLLMASNGRRLPTGAITMLVALAAIPGAALQNWQNIVAAIAAVLGAAVADIAVSAARTRRPEHQGWVAAVPLFVWPAQLLGLHLSVGVAWTVELWAGVVALTVVEAVVLGRLLVTPPDDAAQPATLGHGRSPATQ